MVLVFESTSKDIVFPSFKLSNKSAASMAQLKVGF